MLYGWKAYAQHYWCGARDQGNVWHFDKLARADLHPTIKPVALVKRAIRNGKKPRDTVLDSVRTAPLLMSRHYAKLLYYSEGCIQDGMSRWPCNTRQTSSASGCSI